MKDSNGAKRETNLPSLIATSGTANFPMLSEN